MVGDEGLRYRSCYTASPAKKFGMGDRSQGFIMRRGRRSDGGDEVDH